ncbi:MAG: GIY-YIG nuclease family protein [Acidobacteriales bacterium]|nr:GIY-YIG nuclease family protein [Terriglobales bacterium]
MSNQTPFSLRIFVADGDPDGLRLVERSNWIGKAVMFPRALYPQVRNRSEFQQTGVYLLLGPRTEGDGDTLYIGEGDPVRPRLENHYANKDFWTRAVFFVAGPGQLNKAHVQYLESQLVSRANAAKRMPLENGNNPQEPTLSEADRADMDVFLDNILGMLPVLGVHAFERSPTITVDDGTPVLTCHGRGVTASGHDTPQGFVVQAGSYAANDEVPSLKEHFPNVTEVRADLLKSGVLVSEDNKLRFTQDYTFNSPSLASATVLGRSSNGRVDWKDASGKTLKELQEAQADK